MATSQNGWPALHSGDPLLHTWWIPIDDPIRVTARGGSAGFLLCHAALWFSETIETLAGRVADDWGWAYRPIRGQSTGLSNHSSGTALDLNATQHGLGQPNTFTPAEIGKIHERLAHYDGAIRWGGDYHGRIDSMHWELNVDLPHAETVARRLLESPRGRRLLDANPGQKEVILS